MPVGWIQPMIQASKMHRNSRMENPTRNASAVAIRPLGALGSASSEGFEPRIMYTSAEASEPRMATNARATMTFMQEIMR